MTAMLVMADCLIWGGEIQKDNMPYVLGPLVFYSLCSVSEAIEIGENG